MYKNCKTPRSEARQLEFQYTLLNMLKKQRFDRITIVSLCQQMGITRKPFYKYFDSLEDVLYAILDKELTQGFLHWQYKLEIKEFFDYWRERKWLLDLLQSNGLSDMLVSRSIYVSLYDIPIKDYTINDIKYTGWITAIISVLIAWHQGGMKQNSKEMEQLICEMFQFDIEEVNKSR